MAVDIKTEASKTKVDLGLLEEDDEFEEFPADGECYLKYIKCISYFCVPIFDSPLTGIDPRYPVYTDWTEKEEDADDVNVWEDNWDDDNVEDDFSQQLR